MCGVVAGGVGLWNQGLDAQFVLKTLAPEPAAAGLQLVNITNTIRDGSNFALSEAVAAQGASDTSGPCPARARPRPSATHRAGSSPRRPSRRQLTSPPRANQYKWDSPGRLPIPLRAASELEARAGGNPSWNTGVDYAKQLDKSITRTRS